MTEGHYAESDVRRIRGDVKAGTTTVTTKDGAEHVHPFGEVFIWPSDVVPAPTGAFQMYRDADVAEETWR